MKRDNAPEVYKELLATQWYDAERLHALRTRRLKHVLVEAATNVPYYREAMARMGVDPSREDPWKILPALPIVDKALYRTLESSLRSDRPRRTPLVGHSSGTTGTRLEVFVDRDAATYRYLAGYRGRSWWGIEQGDSELKIWGSGFRTARTNRERLQAVLKEAKEWSIGVTLVSPFFQSSEDLDRATRTLFKTRPKTVFGYANSVFMLASHMVRTGRRAGSGWPKAVFYTAEMLTERQRGVVEDAFGAPVVAEYGSVEAGVMACMCPKGSLHTSDDISVIEIVDKDRSVEAGQTGEVVVTSLMGTEYPLIRYRQGDIASIGTTPCSCGRTLGTL
ncbi:MAG: hypothetical protein WCJ30_28275, partial [Deltaproteobacteria bacterium]